MSSEIDIGRYLWPDIAEGRQPQMPVPVRPRWLQRLAFVASAGSPQFTSEPTLPISAQGNVSVGPGGRGWKTTSATSVIGSTSLIKTSDGVGAGDYSIWCLAQPTASATSSILLSQYTNGTAGQLRLQANLSGALAETAGAMALLDYDGTFSSVGVSSGAIDGNTHLFLGIRRGTTYELWIDGALVASATQTVRNIIQTGGVHQITIGSDPSLSRPSAFPVYMVGAHNRALSNGEASDLGRGWYKSVFASPLINIWPTAAVAGGTTITCTPGNAVADGVVAAVNRAVAASTGNAAADGATAAVVRSIAAAPGNAAADGVASTVSRVIQAGPGNAVADGNTATVINAGTVTITCTTGNAVADGTVAALVRSIVASPGNAVANGVVAALLRVIAAGPGSAVADGVTAAISSASPAVQPVAGLRLTLPEMLRAVT